MKFYSLFLLFLIAVQASAQDSLQSIPVAPGITFSHYNLPGPYSVNVLRIDLTSPDLRLESYRPTGLVPLSSQVHEREREGGQVPGAVNGDFFSYKSLRPIGNQVVNGVFVNGVQSRRSHLGIAGTSRPYILPLSFRGSVVLRGNVVQIRAINQPRAPRETVLYNSYWGLATPHDSTGVKTVLRLLGSTWRVADTIVTLVRQIVDSSSARIAPGEAVVVSDRGEAVRCVVGDTMKLILGFADSRISFTQVVGGGGRILENGNTVFWRDTLTEEIRPAFLTERHPRTFVGVNRDTSVMLLCTVDGRQRSSKGMNFGEMAGFLEKEGAWNAMNFDGGGSTTMVVGGNVVNSPSDSTGQRGVANSVMILLVGGTNNSGGTRQ